MSSTLAAHEQHISSTLSTSTCKPTPGYTRNNIIYIYIRIGGVEIGGVKAWERRRKGREEGKGEEERRERRGQAFRV